MNKELETIKYLLEQCVNETIKKDLLDIETALKDYQTLKREYDFGVEHYNELLNQYNKEHKALEIISQNFKLVGNCLHAKNEYAEGGWVFVKEIEDEEEYDSIKGVLENGD